jgi:hypothetical protein
VCFLGPTQLLPGGGRQLCEALNLPIGVVGMLDLGLRDDEFPVWLALSSDVGGFPTWREKGLR